MSARTIRKLSVPTAVFLVFTAIALRWISARQFIGFFGEFPDPLREAIYFYIGLSIVLALFALGTLAGRRWGWYGLVVSVTIVAIYCAWVVGWFVFGSALPTSTWLPMLQGPVFVLVCSILVLCLLVTGRSAWLRP